MPSRCYDARPDLLGRRIDDALLFDDDASGIRQARAVVATSWSILTADTNWSSSAGTPSLRMSCEHLGQTLRARLPSLWRRSWLRRP